MHWIYCEKVTSKRNAQYNPIILKGVPYLAIYLLLAIYGKFLGKYRTLY